MGRSNFSNRDFIASVRDYLPADAGLRETDAEAKPGRNTSLGELTSNRFYHFDGEALGACAHAVEDLAFEEADGQLLTALQDFAQFEPCREKYEQLAVTLDRVEIVGAGKTPRSIPRVQFIRDAQGACRPFAFVSFAGRRQHALVVARQMNDAPQWEDKRFLGFYSFSARLNARLRHNLLETAAGRSGEFSEFARLLAIDQFAKQMDSEFARQQEEMSSAVRRLQLEGENYRAGEFASDLEKGLTRLQQWKNRLPSVLEQVQSGRRP